MTTHISGTSSTYSTTSHSRHSATNSPEISPAELAAQWPTHNYSAATYGLLSLDIILTTVVVLGRIASRRMMKATIMADDVLTYIAYVFNFGLLITGLVLTSHGAVNSGIILLLKHQQERRIIAGSYVLAVFYVLTITLSRVSILFLYKRMFTLQNTRFRRQWWFILCVSILWAAVCLILLAAQSVHNTPQTGFSRLGIGITGLVSAFADVIMLSLPAVTILKMNIHRKQKLALLTVFAMGAIALVVSVIRASIFIAKNGEMLAISYSSFLVIVLTATESSASLMCACLPLYKPLLKGLDQWWRNIRGRRAENQGWTTLVGSQDSMQKQKDQKSGATTPDPIELRPVQPAHLKPDQKTDEQPKTKSTFD